MLISYISDAIGESKLSVVDLAGNTVEFNTIVKAKVQAKFAEIGLILTNLVIENMSVPKEVEEALDQRTKLGIYRDKTDVLLKVAAAEAMKDAAKNPGMGGAFMGAGVGIGAGAGIGAVFAEAMKPTEKPQEKPANSATKTCSKCGASVPSNAKFCSECGEKLPTKRFCS